MCEFEQILQHDARIGPRSILLGQQVERVRHPAAQQGLEQVEDPHPIGEAKHGAHLSLGHRAVAGIADRLVQ